ncbi:cell wall metabolism sensor histidine kinase WalK [Bacillus sp. PS06]|uniref:cell wall metabolism sensor histidine kinase WalK n=1 Tax=Bacillus sp. PS06 TaxID=2764176 RepID=UPI00178570EA|nr:cell wall metabolism sensor histidine kinase WalK [Bacillus sp. PS06]MBD8071262.1 cell wall metabolism sensor histidine kinase WalK [Bacillus sp. PS06]
MRKMRFFRSIHFKFALIYVLLILIAMQIIGVYFLGKLETQLVENYQISINERVNLLAYNLEQEVKKEREEESTTIESDIRILLDDFVSEDIKEVIFYDNKSRVLGTSSPYNQNIIGRRTTELLVKRTLLGVGDKKIQLEETTNQRLYVSYIPVRSNNEVIGVIKLTAWLENVYEDIKEINDIFVTGTGIAMLITALLGILVAQTITRPITAMKKHAIDLTKGNFSKKVKVYGHDEIGQLAMTFNNLTRKLKDAQATTESERRKLTSVLTHMTDGVIATDKRGRVILINDPALSMLNVSRETAFNKPILSLLNLEEKYSLDDLNNDLDAVVLDFSTEKKPYILKINFSTIQKESGTTNGIIAVLYDITEQEKIDQERREFVANVSHELRTPLTTMKSYLEALADGAWTDKDIAPQFIDVTQTETERMIRLVNDLLQLSKLDSKDYRLTKDWVEFSSFFHKVIDRFEMTKNQDVHFNRRFPNDPVYIEMDKDKITQVLDNIISNALKYSPEGGEVTFHLVEYEDKIEVQIKDDGVGIPKENLSQIFERFYRVDKARTRKLGGTGLGLAIAKEMIEAHGGKIWAKSNEGAGTTIYFTLPIDQEIEDDWS